MTDPGQARTFDGSTALDRLASCPANHVVVGFDGSPGSAAAMSFAVGVAERTSAHVVAAFVANPTCEFADLFSGATILNDVEGVRDAVFEDARSALRTASTRWAYVCVVGEVAVELDRVADRVRADMIVVGRTSAPRHRRMLSCSVSSYLVGRAGRVVIVVP